MLINQAIDLIESLFVNRTDTYAIQTPEGNYSRINSRLTKLAIQRHLQGQITLGTYQLNKESKVKWFLFDLDEQDTGRQTANGVKDQSFPVALTVRLLSHTFTHYEIPITIEFSGNKGGHFWGFLAEAMPASIIRTISIGLLNEVQKELPESVSVEIFPKQNNLPSPDAFGNLVKVPLGIHQITGQRSYFCHSDFTPYQGQDGKLLKAQKEYLESIQKVPTEIIQELYEEFYQSNQSCWTKEAETTDSSGFLYVRESVKAVYNNCEKMRLLRSKALSNNKLNYEERRTFASVFAHIPGGEEEIHEVIKQCTDYEGRGNYRQQITQKHIDNIKQHLRPISCAQICGCENIRNRGKGSSPVAFAFGLNQSAQLILSPKTQT